MGPVLRCPGAGARLRFGIRHSPRVFKVEVHAVKRGAVTWLAAAPSGAGRLALVCVRNFPGASAVRCLSSFKVNPRRAARSDALACANLVCDSSNRLACMGRCWNCPPPESLARGVASCRLTFCSIGPSTAKALAAMLFIFGSSGLCRSGPLNADVMPNEPSCTIAEDSSSWR